MSIISQGIRERLRLSIIQNEELERLLELFETIR